jgi:outer membrane biosynthesis protein TonB
MLRVLLASQPRRTGWVAGTTFSTVVHAVAITALIAASTNEILAPVREQRAAQPLEQITYIEPGRIAEALRAAHTPRRTSTNTDAARAKTRAQHTEQVKRDQQREQQLAHLRDELATLAITPDIAPLPTNLDDMAKAWLAMPDSLGIGTTGRSVASLITKKSNLVPPPDGIYAEDMVDRSVQPRNGNPKPVYPQSLISRNIEGAFVVHFVVDSTGGVEPDKIEFPQSMHGLFINAVRSALLKSRYFPAKIGGKLVRQRVSQEFRFQIIGKR